jgi:hypothetical protein
MAKQRLTSFRLPYLVEEMQQASLVVGNRGLRGELATKFVHSIELLEHGGVVAGFKGNDSLPVEYWVFTSTGYGKLEPEPVIEAKAGKPTTAKAVQ